MSDEHMYKLLSSYNIPKLRYEPLTPYIKMCPTSHKTLKHDNIHGNVLKPRYKACFIKIETSHTLH